jgi:hypothetical protein
MMLSLEFSGWCQIRLGTDPDPYDERTGVSGRTVALASEPELDRVIRFHDPVAPRLGAPEVGVFVRRVCDDGRVLGTHVLHGARVELLDEPKFEGRNGLVADDGYEPIVPFRLRIQGGHGVVICRHDREPAPWDPASPRIPALAHRFGLGYEDDADTTQAVAESIGVEDTSSWRRDRAACLREARERATNAADCLALDLRLDMLAPIDLGRVRYAFACGRHGDDGAVADPDGRLVGPPIDMLQPWPLDLWFGGWDGDGLVAFVSGQLRMPAVS